MSEELIDNSEGCGGAKNSRRRVLFAALASLLALLSLVALPASGQHYVGLKGGAGSASGRFHPLPDKSGMILGKPTAGLVWKYFSAQQVVGGFSVELEYQARGYRLFDGDVISGETSYTTFTRTVNSITMPMVWHPHLT